MTSIPYGTKILPLLSKLQNRPHWHERWGVILNSCDELAWFAFFHRLVILSLTTVRVLIPAGACEEVASVMWLGGEKKPGTLHLLRRCSNMFKTVTINEIRIYCTCTISVGKASN